jgi:hypothetical protein
MMSEGGALLNKLIRVYSGRAPAEETAAPPPADDEPITPEAVERATQAALRAERDRLRLEIERGKELQALTEARQTAARSKAALEEAQAHRRAIEQVGGRADAGTARAYGGRAPPPGKAGKPARRRERVAKRATVGATCAGEGRTMR